MRRVTYLSKGKVRLLLVLTALVTVKYYSKQIETTVKRFNNQSELYNK